MTDTIISIPGAEPLAILDARGWTQGSYGYHGRGPVCLHGAIRLCAPTEGDAQIIEAIARKQGWGTTWNDHPGTSEKMVRALLAKGIEITDDDLHSTFGPQWEAVVWIVRRAAVLTYNEREALGAALNAREATARLDAVRPAAWEAVSTALNAFPYAAWAAAQCAVVWDLAFDAGPSTLKQRDLSIGPWETVIGLPPTLTRSTP